MRQLVAMSLICSGLFISAGCGSKGGTITQEELARRTQELVNSVAGGDQGPWKKYFADDCMFFDERGRNMNKAALVAEITPLPQGSSGTIAVGKVQSHIEGDVAILSYDLNEKEVIFGQEEFARYHETDTWMHRNGERVNSDCLKQRTHVKCFRLTAFIKTQGVLLSVVSLAHNVHHCREICPSGEYF